MARRTSLSKLLVAMTIVLGLLVTAAAVAAGAGRTKTRQAPRFPDRIQQLMSKGDPRGLQGALGQLSSAKDPKAAVETVIRRALLDAADIDSHNEQPGEGNGILLPAGDLNVDGRNDALEWYFGKAFAAVRGSDGRTMWTHDFAGFGVPIAVGSADGDGDDLLTVDVQTVPIPGAYRTTFIYRSLSGRDGAVRWTRTYENIWTEVRSGPTKGHLDLDFAIPMDVGRLDADIAEDFLIGRYDFASARNPSPNVNGRSGAAIFEVIGGRDGLPVTEFPAVGGGDPPSAILVPDGQFRDVVVLSTGDPAGQYRLTAFPGEGGAPRWTVTASFFDYPSLQGVSLNGDARGDVLATTVTWRTQMRAFSGSNGATMWNQEVEAFAYPVPAGDTNGDKGEELLVPLFGWGFGDVVAEGEAKPARAPAHVKVPQLPGHGVGPATLSHCYGYGYGYCPPPCYGYGYGYGCGPPPCYGYGYGYGYGYCPPLEVTDLGLVDGALGAMLWTHTSEGFADVQIAGDATGDGVRDALITDYGYDPQTDEFSATHTLVSGKTGGDSWTATSGGSTYTFPTEGDLDGDGSDDLIRLDWSHKWDAYMAVSGDDGSDAWDELGNVGGYLWSFASTRLGPTGSGEDILETLYRNGRLFTAARSGADGTHLWKRPAKIGPPAP